MSVLYITDRAVSKESAVGPVYGHLRASGLTFGEAVVSIRPHTSWEQLAADSVRGRRSSAYELKTTSIRELGGILGTLDYLDYRRHEMVLPPDATAQMDAEQKRFFDLLEARLALTDHKDVFIYVHGFANTFDDAVFRCAELWHFMGRVGVPIAYTWPAGSSGVFSYFKDRESGEFTVFHLKQFLRTVAACPSVERIHVIGHSRGTDVATTAIRELSLGFEGLRPDAVEQLKLETLVLASPDLDVEVFSQRFLAERLALVPRRMVVYCSPTDIALKASTLLFGGRRLGRLNPNTFSPRARQALASFQTLELIDCDVSGFSTTHDYEFAHPAVLSDLILVLRERRDPGAENGRPLRVKVEGVWEINNDYGLPAKNRQSN
jgi:esterase/lipase superfamily enzyme